MVNQYISKDFKISGQSQKDKTKKRKNESKNLLVLAKFSNVGYYLLFPILSGIFLGLFVDNFFKTKPVFTVIFLIFGSIATFYNLFQLTKK